MHLNDSNGLAPPGGAGPNRRQWLAATASAALSAAAGPARAQAAWPSRPVKIIVPFPAAGPVDGTGRALAAKLPELWGQQVVVDNRAGAGGIVGAEVAAKAAPDGYTFFLGSIHHSVIPALNGKVNYDIERDFVPVSFATLFPVILVAHPSVPAKNVAELIALAKKEPTRLSYGSAGNGGGTHLAAELFKMQAGVQIQHVPYKGSAPAMTDLLGGQVQLMFSDAPTALPQIRAGKVRALAVCSTQRSALLPELPTVAESGLPGYEAYSWSALFAPAGTPREIVQKASEDVNKVLGLPDVKQRLFDAGAEAMPGTPEQLTRLLRTELAKWAKVVKAANIQAD